MAPLKVGVIGFRNNGHSHSKQIAAGPKTRLVAVADLVESRRQTAREEFGLEQVYGDYRELIDQSHCEAVVISLPVFLHCQAVLHALNAGKHVLCEKPPAVNAREARRMVSLARKKGLVLSWGLQRRFLPGMRVARREIGAGRLGSIYRINARYTVARSTLLSADAYRMRKSGGGVFFDLGVHALDMAWSLLGCPKARRAVAANHTAFPDWNAVERREDMAEDNSLAMVFFEGGAVVSVETSFCANHSDPTQHGPQLQILGDQGGLHIPSLTFVWGGPAPTSLKRRVLKAPKSWEKNATAQMHANFADAVAGRAELAIPAEQGVELMRMLDAVIKSAQQDREIRLGP